MNEKQLSQIIAAAEAGGQIIREYFGANLAIEEKSIVSDIRTKADTESETAIIKSLQSNFPSFNILSEESGFIEGSSEYKFVIDPLDGSNNFVMGMPNFSVSIALLRGEEVVAGVIYVPMIDQIFSALKGYGAFQNSKRIMVNNETAPTRSTVSYTCGYINDPKYTLLLAGKLSNLELKRTINFWSPAYDYCLLASGKIEAVINNNNEIYDFAAGKIILTEAGGKITAFDGSHSSDTDTQFVASNGTELHDVLIRVV